MTFSRSDNILPHEFPTAPTFLSRSHRFVFAPGGSVFFRNDHLGAELINRQLRGQGGSQASQGHAQTNVHWIHNHTASHIRTCRPELWFNSNLCYKEMSETQQEQGSELVELLLPPCQEASLSTLTDIIQSISNWSLVKP